MHTLRIIAGGLALLALFVVAARIAGRSWHEAMAATPRWFVPVWLIAALVNMWVGVTTAGYTVAQEAPILVVVFAVPAAIALLLRHFASRT